MSIHSKYILCLILLFSVFCFSGCGPKRPPLGKIEGTVRFDGEPIESGTIIFTVSGQRDASGQIVNGNIKDVTTFDIGDGAPVGEARIAVIVIKDSPAQAVASPAFDDSAAPGGGPVMRLEGGDFAIPPRYFNPETSGLTTTIKQGITNSVNLELTK